MAQGLYIPINMRMNNCGELNRCTLTIENGIGRHRLLFRFGFSPSTNAVTLPLISKNELYVESIIAQVQLAISAGSYLLIGALQPNIEHPILYLNCPRDHMMQLELSSQELLHLADRTDSGGLRLRLSMNFMFSVPHGRSGPEHSEFEIPHSEWVQTLEKAALHRYELITLRTPLRGTPAYPIYDECLNMLKEAQETFNRGDWNGVGGKCRPIWNTIKGHAADQRKAVEELLNTVTGDPRRKKFGEAVVKGVIDVLNNATHLEGDPSKGTLPADLRREDAALCLHWTAALLRYLAEVDPPALHR